MVHLLFVLAFCCAPSPPMADYDVNASDLIFVGEVIDAAYQDGYGVYRFRVTQSFKGIKLNESITIYSGLSSIGIHAKVGQEWLVVPVYKKGKGWITRACSYSTQLTNVRSTRDIEFLEECFNREVPFDSAQGTNED